MGWEHGGLGELGAWDNCLVCLCCIQSAGSSCVQQVVVGFFVCNKYLVLLWLGSLHLRLWLHLTTCVDVAGSAVLTAMRRMCWRAAHHVAQWVGLSAVSGELWDVVVQHGQPGYML
jgi:hypothetical protein